MEPLVQGELLVFDFKGHVGLLFILREVAPENHPNQSSMLRWGQRILSKFAPDVDIEPKTRHEKFFRNFLPRNLISGHFYPEISPIFKNFR